jgi:outer membrane protein assembly factor BamB
MKHAIIYQSQTDSNLYLLGFEDQGGSVSDFDYNDMVFTLQGIGSTTSVPFSVTAATGGTVTVQSSAINSGNPVTVNSRSTESWPVSVGTIVQLQANSNGGDSFGSWTVTSGVTGSGGSPLDLQSASISATVIAASNILANFIDVSTTAPSTGSASSSSGLTLQLEASLIKAENGYNFTLQITPPNLMGVGDTFLLFTDNDIQALNATILDQLGKAGLISSGASVDFIGCVNQTMHDQNAIEIVDALMSVPSIVGESEDYVQAFGTATGLTLSAAKILADQALIPTPSDIVNDLIEQMAQSITQSDNGIENEMLNVLPVCVQYSSQVTCIEPKFIVGPDQALEIVITGLKAPPNNSPITLQIYGTNEVLLETPPPRPNFVYDDSGAFLVSAGYFAFPVELSQGWLYGSPWPFSGDYEFPTTEVQDPTTQFIEATTNDSQLTNAVFDSSPSVLTMSVAIPADSTSEQGGVDFLVPPELNPTNSTSFSLTLNGASIPFNLTSAPGIGFNLNATITENGTLALYIPSLAPSIALAAKFGTLYVSGSGFEPNLAMILQYYNGTDWTDLPGSGDFSTSVFGYFLYQNATPSVSSGILMVRAIDLNGNTAISSIALINILSFSASPPSPANADSMVTLTATAESATGTPLLYRFSTDGGVTWDNWGASNTFDFVTENASGVYYTLLVEVTDGANPLVDGPPITYQVGARAPMVQDDWSMFHHDLSHTGYSTSTAPNTNQTLWKYETAGQVLSSPAVVDGVLYVGSSDNKTYALNSANGSYIWSYPTGGMVASSPAVVSSIVYVGSEDGNVYALDALTGALIWNYTTGSPVQSSPAVAGGIVYVGSDFNGTYALNATTGAIIWNQTISPMVYDSPAVADGIVYVGSIDVQEEQLSVNGGVYALNATTGALIWNYTTSSHVYSSPTVADGRVYIGDWNGEVYCLNALTGAYIWSYAGSRVYSTPAIAYGKVYIGSYFDNKTYALDAFTGALIWSYTTGGPVDTPPAVAGGLVYVGSWDNKTYALDAFTGALIWSYTTGGPVDNDGAAVADDVVYIGSCDGNVYAFGVHDIAVTDVTSSKNGCLPIPTVGEGFNVTINVTVANQGGYTETFNATAFVNTTAIQTETLSLPSQNSATVIFIWNTTGCAYGSYTISAYATPVQSETNTANNNCTDGTVEVTIPGDVNGDGTVNILDAIQVSNSFLATPSSSNWNPNADINGDGVVNILDAIILSNHFVQKIP